MSWGEFVARLRKPKITWETFAQYEAMTASWRANVKDVGGFMCCQLKTDGRRKLENIATVTGVQLDVDNATPTTLQELTMFCEYRAVAYSTHSHSRGRPRLRVILPVDRVMNTLEAEAVGRKIAEQLGILENLDATTFEPNQLMYWPSHARDGDYVIEEIEGRLINVDEVLAAYRGQDEWVNPENWPRIPGETIKDRLGARMENPLTKPGIIGLFCRAYRIPDAIDQFLPDVYKPTMQPDRYTYTRGEGASGLVIYDDGLFAYSNHATDPVGGREVNAWDLVRVHKYGELDEKIKPGTPINQWPSYKAMQELALVDERVREQADLDRRKELEADFQPIKGENRKWVKQLALNRSGAYADTLPNYETALAEDQRLQAIRFNEFTRSLTVENAGGLPWVSNNPGWWGDLDLDNLRMYLAKTLGLSSEKSIMTALNAVTSQQRRYHPIKDRLAGLVWDGVARVDRLFIDYLGTEDTELHRKAARLLLSAAVARVHQPGIKYDFLIVLQGRQGIGKSMLTQKLSYGYFCDTISLADMQDAKIAGEKLQGVWFAEIAELTGIRKAEVEAVKGFISRTDDVYRGAYQRIVERRPRQTVLVGTTNEMDGYLRDLTGNRRFIPVVCGQSSEKKAWEITETEVDQLYAEVMACGWWKQPLTLVGEAAKQAEQAREDNLEDDLRVGLIEEFLAEPVPVDWYERTEAQRRFYRDSQIDFTDDPRPVEGIARKWVSPVEILVELFGRRRGDIRKYESMEINKIIARLPGWVRGGLVRDPVYGRQRVFLNADEGVQKQWEEIGG